MANKISDDYHVTWHSLSEQYLQWLKLRNYSDYTIKTRRCRINFFIVWCEQRSIGHPQQVTPQILAQYQQTSLKHRRYHGKKMSVGSYRGHLITLSHFFYYLLKKQVIVQNPTATLKYPKQPYRLPAKALTPAEIEQVINQADVDSPLGLRDRAMMETLYSTGIRRQELRNLSLWDVDLANGTVFVKEGKGKKDRLVPLGQRAIHWLRKYLREARPVLLKRKESQVFFLSCRGAALSLVQITKCITKYMRASGHQRGACHLFRHAMATSMLKGGADLRHIQAILGHESVNTTEIYTHLDISHLQKTHAKTHPAGKQDKDSASAVKLTTTEQVWKFPVPTRKPSPSPLLQQKNEDSILVLVSKYLKWMETAHYSSETVRFRTTHLLQFSDFCGERGVTDCYQLTPALIDIYQSRVMSTRDSKEGNYLAVGTCHNSLMSVVMFFRWLEENHLLLSNPTATIELPRLGKRLLPPVLTHEEIKQILEKPDLTTAFGIRDRVILEVLYGTGIRRQELVAIELEDIHWANQTLFIRQGKGRKQRHVPLGQRTLAWLENYLQVRELLCRTTPKTLFLNVFGNPMSKDGITHMVKKYMRAANIHKKGSSHLFRHAIATTMLDNGASLRCVQELLGHAHLQTTTIYTKMSISKLKEVHKKTHPAGSEPKKMQQSREEIEDSTS